LGGDEFGVVLPGARRDEAAAVARAIHDVIATRIECSIGVATSEDGETTSDDFLRVADAALYACKGDDTMRVQTLVAGSARSVAAAPRLNAKPPSMTYAQLRRAGGPPERPAQGIHSGWLLRGSFWVVAASGAMIIAGIAIEGSTNTYGDLILLIGAPWIAANLLLGWVYFGSSGSPDRSIVFARFAAAMLVGAGITIAMLSHGGITAPIIAGLYLKVLFDAVALTRRQAAETAAVSIAWWLLAVALSPADQLWAVPYQLTVFAVSFGLGVVARRAFTDATSQRLRLAHTDALTGLRNRPGFTQGAERAFAAARAEQRPFAIVAFDLDDFKQVNDTKGHAAGDALLQEVARITKSTLPSAYSVGRLGGDEFVAAVPAGSVEEAGALATALTTKLTPIVGASIGCAVYPADGHTLEALLQSADHRSYSAKPGRTRHSPLAVAPDDDGIAAA
ncbi:MAG: diguanylate cyclase, partial [Solirubrobacteraceae bacterium]|nr:diguanylate cyclase [Solirubrobacteraceae bacterium]